jgi:hypothetical protein
MLEVALGIMLTGLIVFFTLDFDKPYISELHNAARHPLLRFLGGLAVVGLAMLNPMLAMLGLIVVFFWIADVNLLSSFSL